MICKCGIWIQRAYVSCLMDTQWLNDDQFVALRSVISWCVILRLNNVIFKIPSRTVPEYHLEQQVLFPWIVLSYYTQCHNKQNSANASPPLLPDSIVWESKNCPLHYTLYRLSRSRSITTNSRPEQKYFQSEGKKSIFYPSLEAICKASPLHLCCTCSTKWVLATAFTFLKPSITSHRVRR